MLWLEINFKAGQMAEVQDYLHTTPSNCCPGEFSGGLWLRSPILHRWRLRYWSDKAGWLWGRSHHLITEEKHCHGLRLSSLISLILNKTQLNCNCRCGGPWKWHVLKGLTLQKRQVSLAEPCESLIGRSEKCEISFLFEQIGQSGCFHQWQKDPESNMKSFCNCRYIWCHSCFKWLHL